MRETPKTLPKLPVPDPKNTLKHFLNFAEALQTRKDFEETKSVVNDFVEKELPTLQKLLEERAAKLNNWLTPWWLNVAYLEARAPLPVVTSPGLIFPHFPCTGKGFQSEYAAKVTQAAVEFHLKVLRGELPQDMFGKTPFDMSQYMFIFGTTRIPKKGCDKIRYGFANENQQRHIIVLHNGHVTLITMFNSIIKRSPERLSHSVGIISSDNRDLWSEVYEQLKAHPTNSVNLSCIEDALFAVCLDQEFKPSEGYQEKDEMARQCLHGGGVKSNACNRWYDKTLQFLIGKNGFVGINYEHTPAEGPPIATMADFICDKIFANDFKDDFTTPEVQVQRLDFELNDSQKAQIRKSEKQLDCFILLAFRVADDLDVAVHTFTRFGKNFPKSVGISPDSFIQMAFQLAFYRIHSTCEFEYLPYLPQKLFSKAIGIHLSPSHTSIISLFISMMSILPIYTGTIIVEDIYDALKAAADSHKNYTLECMNGTGMDRHLLAWNLLAAENGLAKPSILKTPAYQQMSHFQVSTSQVPTRNHLQLGFGPSAPDCYGICYNPQETELHFTITSFKSYGSTNSKRFVKELDRALDDMNLACSKATRERSKL
uniref:Carn_acyltransf domain-containing protein n=1 Tax=Angiostrongylus cantonensis TaxID=6313 RepID=A0A158P805_ANGCA